MNTPAMSKEFSERVASLFESHGYEQYNNLPKDAGLIETACTSTWYAAIHALEAVCPHRLGHEIGDRRIYRGVRLLERLVVKKILSQFVEPEIVYA